MDSDFIEHLHHITLTEDQGEVRTVDPIHSERKNPGRMLTRFDRKISHIQTLQPKSDQITTEVGLEVWERPADCGRRGWTFPFQIHHGKPVEVGLK